MFPLRRPSEPGDARTVLARKGSLRRAKPARPCALRAVPPNSNCDGRLRRERDDDDQFAGTIYLRKGNSVSPLDKLIMLIMEVPGNRVY